MSRDRNSHKHHVAVLLQKYKENKNDLKAKCNRGDFEKLVTFYNKIISEQKALVKSFCEAEVNAETPHILKSECMPADCE